MSLFRRERETKIKALSGKPNAVILKDRWGVQQGVRIKDRYKNPDGNRLADVGAIAGTIYLAVQALQDISQMPAPQFEPLIFPLVAYLPLKWLLRQWARPELNVDILTDVVRVSGLIFPKVYDREDVECFAVVGQDEKAQSERQRHEFEARRDQIKRRARFRTSYYQHAADLIIVVRGERIKIASYASSSEAQRVSDRLNRVLRDVNEQMQRNIEALRAQVGNAVPGQLPD